MKTSGILKQIKIKNSNTDTYINIGIELDIKEQELTDGITMYKRRINILYPRMDFGREGEVEEIPKWEG